MLGDFALHQPTRCLEVELLPIHTFINDSNLLEKGLTNYWGYNSLAFFAPDARYCATSKCLATLQTIV